MDRDIQRVIRNDINRRKHGSARQRQRRRRRQMRIALCIAVPLFVVICGLFVFLKMHPLFLKQDVVIQEFAEEFHPLENIGFVFGGKVSEVNVKQAVDVSKQGDYEVTYSFGGHEKTAVVQVRDTKAPELEVQTYTTDLVEEVKPEQFVKEVTDASEVTLQFEKQEKWDRAKTYKVGIVAQDSSGNRTVKTAELIRKKDETKPEIEGAEEVSVLQGKELDFQQGITVKDDLDPNPALTVDTGKTNLNQPGSYTVTYTVKDRSGNETVVERKVTVRENEELGKKVVYLTFDDGPSNNTEKILDILDQYGAKATFFVTGNNRKRDDLIKRAYDEGHSIGLHTYSHDYPSVYASMDAYFDDLQKISDMVKEITGEESHIIRFPGGSSNTVSAKYVKGLMTELTKEVQARGYQYFDWNCDSTDAEGNRRPVDVLVRNATSSSKDHVNILMHDTDAKNTTVEALPQIIQSYKDRGYTFLGITVDSFAPHHGLNN